MSNKKILCLFLTLVMLVSIMTACGKSKDGQTPEGNGETKDTSQGAENNSNQDNESDGEKPVITFMSIDHAGKALKNVGAEEVIQAAQEYTGIKVDYNWVANDSYEDVLGITLMDKANMPMVITYGSDLGANIVQAAKDDAFWDLNEFVWDEEKYPNLSQMNEDVANSLTVDGKLIGVYRSRPIGRNGLGYREDWANKLGIEEPKTIEDVYNMMYEFTYGDPDGNGVDDTYGLALCKYTGPLDIIQAWFGTGNQWKEVDGKLIPIHQTEEYKEALKWMRKMYEDGLVYEDWATRDTNTWSDSVKNGECGMFLDVLDNSRRIWDYFENEGIPAVDGNGNASMKLVGGIAKDANSEPVTLATSGHAGAFLITKAGAKTVEDVENCLKYLDKMNDEPMRILADYGIEGRDHEINDEGFIVDFLADKEVEEKPQVGLNQTIPYLPEVIDMKTVEKSDRLITEEAIKLANVDIAVFNPASGYLVSSKVNAEVGTDLKDIIDRARTQYICLQIDEDGLEEQFNIWEERGGSSLIQDINTMYEADKNR